MGTAAQQDEDAIWHAHQERKRMNQMHMMTQAARDALDADIKELRRQIRLRDAALAECHKEIFKLRDALLSHPVSADAITAGDRE